MRSRCRRSIITMSAPASPSRMSRYTSTPNRSMPGGSRVEGATTRTRAPSVLSRMMFDRATRECRMSPQIVTTRPSMRPLLRRMVSASSSAWVGCSCAPSPALITAQSTFWASSSTAPEAWWRTTRMSGCMALSVIAVSMSVSPLRIEELLTAMFITSAPSRLPASSKDDWVRVEASKNRLIWVRPRSEARFFSICRLRSTNSSPRSSRPVISSRESPSIPNRCRRLRTKEGRGAMFIKAGSIGGVGGGHKDAFAAVHRARAGSAGAGHGNVAARGDAMAAAFERHEVLNQSPPFEDVDLFGLDRPLQDALTANGAGGEAAALSAFGRRYGSAEMLEEARRANENPPKLASFDRKGFRRDTVEFHPAYHRLMGESIAAGVHASPWRADGSRAAAPAEVLRAARFYLANQVEA